MIGLKQYIIEKLQNGYFDSNTKSKLFLLLSKGKTENFEEWLSVKKLINICVWICDRELQKSILDTNNGEPFPMGMSPQSIKNDENFKVADYNFNFVSEIENEFNSLSSSKKFSKEYQKKFDRMERQSMLQEIKDIVNKNTSSTLSKLIQKEGY